ncbi:hypothetical protein ACWZEH_07815 [Streptomyces sp. QTS137]
MIEVAMTSVYVDDVAKAHAFCTGVPGFGTRTRTDLGDGTPLVTVGAGEGAQRDLELLLEPGQGPPSRNRTAGRCGRRGCPSSCSR